MAERRRGLGRGIGALIPTPRGNRKIGQSMYSLALNLPKYSLVYWRGVNASSSSPKTTVPRTGTGREARTQRIKEQETSH